jgi:hypothetical protein
MRTVIALCLTVALTACDDPVRPSRATDVPASFATIATEPDAIAISANIQRLHVPYGTMIDPVFASSDPASPDFTRLVSYTRAGDAAIWTGHYLAAEAFRYGVTQSREALRNVRRTIDGIAGLVEVTGTDLLARFYMPTTSPYVADITAGEQRHTRREGVIDGQPYYWWGNTSRDQYSGVFFGLGVTYDMVNDEQTRRHVRRTVTRLLNFLLRNGWNVVMPDGQISTTFIGRADQQRTAQHSPPRCRSRSRESASTRITATSSSISITSTSTTSSASRSRSPPRCRSTCKRSRRCAAAPGVTRTPTST